MALKFTQAGLESVALTGDDPPHERDRQLSALRAGRLRCVFSVEVLGEGIDVPDVDCVLLLRPTESATVFTQQLGRGLRRAAGKSHLTVIDLIGQHRREFRFEDRLKAIVDARRGPIIDQVAADFPFLPAGCTVDLDRQSREIVLDNLRAAVRRSRWATLVADLRAEQDATQLGDFLNRHDHRLEDVYRSGSWTRLRRDAGRTTAPPADPTLEARTLKALTRLTHIDDPERVTFYREQLLERRPPRERDLDARHKRLITMLAWGLGSGTAGHEILADFLEALWREDAIRTELLQLLDVIDQRSNTPPSPALLPSESDSGRDPLGAAGEKRRVLR
jgi:superfamily II DNA/RNA helicase